MAVLTKGESMNKEQAEGKFEQLKGKIKETWGKLSDDDVMLYNGQREQFFGKLKEHYGFAKEEAEQKLKALEESFDSSSTKAA
jgi:uncharacterized protein YjbJ (UPF0337 family)